MREAVVLGTLALLALAGCKPTEIGPGAPTRESVREAADDARMRASEAKVPLPPSIAASATYRCADDSLLMVDWMSDGRTANARTSETAPSVRLSAPVAGDPLTVAGGWSVRGSAKDGKAEVSTPAHPKAMACHA